MEKNEFELNFMYAGGAMGWGNGHPWHKLLGLKFPYFPIITRSEPETKKIGQNDPMYKVVYTKVKDLNIFIPLTIFELVEHKKRYHMYKSSLKYKK